MSSDNFLHDYLAGAIGGCAGIAVGHPFDTVKVQLQTQEGNLRFNSLRDCVRVVQSQGLKHGFFRGLSWPLLSSGAINSVLFGVYGWTLRQLRADTASPSLPHVAIASGAAGMAQLSIACPIETVKVVLQSQIQRHALGQDGGSGQARYYRGPMDAARDIVRHRGVGGLYRGCGTQLVRDVPASIVYLVGYEAGTRSISAALPVIPKQMVNFVVGGVAGVVSWLVIMPFDLVKSRLQADSQRSQYRGFWDCAAKAYREEGLRVFFRGSLVVSLRAFPVNAVTLMVYSESLRMLSGPIL